jgi:iron(III) transport system permease protein
MTIAMTLAGIALTYLLAVPLVVQAITAFRGPFLPFGVPSAKWGFGNFVTLWELRRDFWSVIGTTAVFVGGSTILALLIAFGLAWLVVRTDVPFRRLIPVLVIVPFVIPPIVKAQAYFLMASPGSGVLNQLIRAVPFVDVQTGPINPYSFGTVVVIQALTNVTFPFLMFVPILTNMDGGLEEAARASGATWAQTLRRVTLPMLWPGILGVGILTFILSLGSLEVPLLFGQQSGRDIFALKLWHLISSSSGELPQYGLAAAWGLVFLVFTSIAFLIYLRATRDAETRASVSGKGFRPQRMSLGRGRIPILVLVAVFVVVTAVLPLFALLWSSITPYPVAFSFDAMLHKTSFGAFPEVFGDPEFWASLWRTVIIAAGSATLAVVVSTVLAYGIARGRKTWRNKLVDLLASSSVAIPATIAGFSSFLLYLVINKWVPLSGTVLAMILAYAYRVSISYRTSYSATLQIRKELEEAASSSGASRIQVFRRIVLPLLTPAVIAVWIQLFILGANEFTLPAFLATPESRPLSTYLYAMINPRSAQLYAPDRGAAMALIFTLMVFVIGYGLQFWQNRRGLARGTGTRGGRRARAAIQPAVPVPVDADGTLELPELATPGPRT